MKNLFFLCATVMLVALLSISAFAAKTVEMTIDNSDAKVNGFSRTLDAAPVIRNERTMLPIRFVAETLGASVGWDGETSSVTVTTSKVQIKIAIGASVAYVNGAEVALDSPAFIENSRTYMPVRFIAENLGASVGWDGETSTVTLKLEPQKIFTSGDFTVERYHGIATIKKYNGSAASVSVPETIDGYTVTEIGYRAFDSCTSLESVTLPGSITEIGKSAFYGCTSLASIDIPDSVLSIADNAFTSCTSLARITIPGGVTEIGARAFSDCTSLASITIPNSVISIGARVFDRCTSLASITIPDSVTTIGDAAFYYCSSLVNIFVSEDNPAYCDISGVLFTKDMSTLVTYSAGRKDKTYKIPDGVTTIGGGAFHYCRSLVGVTIPKGITTIGNAAFSNCGSLKNITIPSSVETIGMQAFFSCSSLKSITLSHGVTTIGKQAFFFCSSLESITLPDSVTSIGENAFAQCNRPVIKCKKGSVAAKYVEKNSVSQGIGVQYN